MALGDIILSAISQSQKNRYCEIPLPRGPAFTEWNAGVQGPGEGMGSECLSNGDMVSVWEDEEFWGWMVLLHNRVMSLLPLNCPLENRSCDLYVYLQ